MARGKFPNADFVDKAIRDSMNDLAEQAKKLMLQPTETWKNHKPAITSEVRMIGDDLVLKVFTNSKIYSYLDYGTGIRYATMTDDFQPKTTVGSFSAGQGQGGLAFVNKKRPRPGIEARGWSEMMYEDFEPALQDIINDILRTTTEASPLQVERGALSPPTTRVQTPISTPSPPPMSPKEVSFLGKIESKVRGLLRGLFGKMK